MENSNSPPTNIKERVSSSQLGALVAKLETMNSWFVLAISITVAEIITLLTISVMGLIFQNRVTIGDVIAGAVAALLFGLLAGSFMLYELRQVQSLDQALRESEVLLRQANLDTERYVTEIKRRSTLLQAAAQVSRATTGLLDPDELLNQVVDLVRDWFDLYYVGLFLVDEDRHYAILRAGTGEAGQKMLERNHRLAVGSESMIGQSVARDEARIALDVGEEAVRFDNPLLPQTRSEMAIPLRSRGRVVGAMTVQSAVEAAFDETSIAVMQTMADQVAVAIDNARLFANAQVALEEMETTHRRYLRQAWSEYIRTAQATHYETTTPDLSPLGDDVLPEITRALQQQRTIALTSDAPDDVTDETDATDGTPPSTLDAPPNHSALVTPVMLRGEIIGGLGIHDDEARQWSAEDIGLIEAIAERLALAADNLRLIDQTQRRAARDRLIGQVTTRVRETLDIETMLKTAVQEVRQALDLPEVAIRLAPQTVPGSGNGTDGGQEKQDTKFPYRDWPSDGGDNV